MESKSILKRKAVQKGKGINDIIVELSDEDRLAGHIPDEYYKLARDHDVFYEDKKLGKLVQILDLTEGEEAASCLSIKGDKTQDVLNNGEAVQLVCRCNERLREENQELLQSLKEAAMIIDGAYPSDNKFIAAVLAKFNALITKIEVG